MLFKMYTQRCEEAQTPNLVGLRTAVAFRTKSQIWDDWHFPLLRTSLDREHTYDMSKFCRLLLLFSSPNVNNI